MEAFFASGRAVDVALLVVAIEVAVLWGAGSRLGLARTPAILNLAAGVCLLLGVRAALTGASWPWVAGLLSLSLPFHGLDVALRARFTAVGGRTGRSD